MKIEDRFGLPPPATQFKLFGRWIRYANEAGCRVPTLTPLETSRNFLEALPNSLTHLRFLGGPEGEEDGKVRRELPGEGLADHP